MINLFFIIIMSSSLWANSTVFYLPDFEANLERVVKEKQSEADPKARYSVICDKEAMKGKEFVEMVAYQRVTGLDCWELILEQAAESSSLERLPATTSPEVSPVE